MKPITKQRLAALRQEFEARPENRVARNAVVRGGLSALTDYSLARRKENVYSVEVTDPCKIADQKQSGRCWMFAALNVMRTAAMRRLNVEDIEFSQAYPLFWDKLERSNYFLESILKTANQPLEGRLVSFLLSAPMGDGGQWDMFANLVKKYGVVPKAAMPESKLSSATAVMNRFLSLKLREDARILREAVAAGRTEAELLAQKEAMVAEIYRMLSVCLGTPPERVVYEARDKDKNFLRIGPVTPQEFFQEAVGWDLDDYVSLISAPTPDKPFYQTYTVDYLGNVAEGSPVMYLNLPIEELKAAVVRQLSDDAPVWFGCDVGQWHDRDQGVMDLASYQLQDAFGVTFGLDKAGRLQYGESCMTHAMVFFGVNLDENGKPDRFKVMNSWGDDRGQKGWYVMSDGWFDEFVYQALIHKQYLTEAQKAALAAKPVHLAPWDPMGSLAK